MTEGNEQMQGPGTGYMCPLCGAPVRLDAPECPACGVQFAPPEEAPPVYQSPPPVYQPPPPAAYEPPSLQPPAPFGREPAQDRHADARSAATSWEPMEPPAWVAPGATAGGSEPARSDRPPRSRPARLEYGNQDAADPYTRRRHFAPAGKVLLVLLIGLLLAALLNAQGLRRQAEAMDYGKERTFMIGLTAPFNAIASVLQINRVHRAMDAALGRGDQTQSGLATRTTTPSPTPSVTASGSAKPSASGSPKPAGGIFTPTKANPLYTYVAGDSMAMIFGQSFQAMASRTGVIKTALDYKVSSGLVRPDFFDWPKRIKAQVASYKPTTAVFVAGANDGQGISTASGPVAYGTKEWDTIYSERVGQAMDLLGSKGQRQVFWVGMPNAKNTEQSAIYKHIDALAIAEAKQRPWVHYVDTYKLFSTAGGGYSDYLTSLAGKSELVRQSDGVHWTRPGGDMAADAVLKAMAKVYKFKYPD